MDHIEELREIIDELQRKYDAVDQSLKEELEWSASQAARIAELERENSLLKEQAALNQAFFAGPDEDGDRITELEAENAALKAANEWRYLPETPGTIRDVLGAFAGADALIECYYHFRTGKWYASEECADFSDADVCNKEMSKAPYAWQELPQMPPRP